MLQAAAPARPNSRVDHSTTNIDMQRPLVRWSRQGDIWTPERACEHTLIVGGIGSSKSTAGMNLTAMSLLESPDRFGFFFHSGKPSGADDAYDWARRAGRESDIIHYGPGSGESFNWPSYEYQDFGDGKGHVDNLMAVFKSLIEVIMRSAGQRESEPFWQFMQDQGMKNMFFIDGQANGGIDLSRILEMWQSIPQGFGDLYDPQQLLSMTALMEAEKKCPPEKRRSLALAKTWLLKQMPALSERTKSCVEAMAIGMLDPHARDIMQEAMGGESTWTPDSLDAGKIIICGWDIKRYDAIGKLIQVACKRSIQRWAERRLAKYPKGMRGGLLPIFLVADEAQFFIDGQADLDFLRTARESRAGCLWAVQSIPSVVAELGGGPVAENLFNAIAGMFETKIYHYNNCPITNRKCAEWIGEDMQKRPGGSIGIDPRGRVNRGENWSDQPYFLVPPIAWQRLPRGGEAERWNVRAFVTMARHEWKCNHRRYWAKIKLFQSCAPGDGHGVGWPSAPVWTFFEKVASARRWSLHVPLREAMKGWPTKFNEYVMREHVRKTIVTEGQLAKVEARALFSVTWKLLKRWWAFWIDDRETLLGGGHE
jgi:hypothetical protein